ncbi:MAG TPA: 4Fe-4S dicluster domain-containing protein, partial [Thermoanaerobaculia bacterium]|nr:4Fe-4S dicluster domain-containing protein [Thermoanaerobaculia bacterium]
RHQELPDGRTLWETAAQPGESRRDFLKVMGFSLAAATVASCTPIPQRKAVPLVDEPEGLIPGVANYYATTCGGCAAGCGLLVKVRDGRPIKIEGNPDSPLSQGGTCAVGQATVLSLYDDQRLKKPLLAKHPVSWQEADAAVIERLAGVARSGGRIVVLTGNLQSPATRQLLGEWLARYPGARHVVYEPVSAAALRQATAESFGRPVLPRYRLERARLVVSLDADFLGTWLSPVEFARCYAAGRRPERAGEALRHIQIESGLSLTGSNADQRIAVLPSELGPAALVLLATLARAAAAPTGAAGKADDPARIPLPAGLAAESELQKVAAELWRHRGSALVLCGANDVATQRIVHRINALLGGLGGLGGMVDLDNPSFQSEGDDAAMAELVEQMERREVQALIVQGVNPLYDYPQAARLKAALSRVGFKVAIADRLDETASAAEVVCPGQHFLEAWGEAEPVAGWRGLTQPTIAPLFASRSLEDNLLAWQGASVDWHTYLREHWRREVFPRQDRVRDFDDFWDRSLEAGGATLPPVPAHPASPTSDTSDLSAAIRTLLDRYREARAARGDGRFEVLLHEKVAIRDGRLANNPWLQELPDPVTKVAWGNYVSVAPRDAARLGLAEGDIVTLQGTTANARLELPVQIQPGQAPGAVAVALGYGRTAAGKVGNGVGANAFPLQPLAAGFVERGAWGYQIAKTGRHETLAATQTHHSMEGRSIVRETTTALYRQDPAAGNERAPELPSLWAEYKKEGHFWGMSIDLAACTGCAACVVACQAENNVAVVGKEEVRRGREMHWIRIDRYYSGSEDAPATVYQPMMCQHCDHAPCETVCPVLATVHSSDGLNQQAYNRCIGTRYCANNCPYKVRRFNWFNYARNDHFDYHMNSDLGRMVLNPDVVVRSRGVMEKCSLCTQRIQEGKLKGRHRPQGLQDGDIKTACQQACPTDAIVFGDLNDHASQVARLHEDPRHYRVLEELGTRPGVVYLTKLRVEA